MSMKVGAETNQCSEKTSSCNPETLGGVLRRNGVISPASLAIVSSAYEPLSFAELAKQLDRVGAALRGAGLGQDSRIAVVLEDAPQAALAIISVCCSAIAVPLDPNLAPIEMAARLKHLGVDAAIILAGDDSPISDVIESQGIRIIKATPRGDHRLELRLDAPENDFFAASDPAPEATAFILQSSGTTADPKLVPYSHVNMIAAAARVKKWFDLTENDRCLSISPAYYSHGLKLTVLTSLLSGGSVAFPKSPSRVDLVEWFGSLSPTWFSASPTAHRAILEKAQQQEGETVKNRLRFALSGGAPLPSEIQTGLRSALRLPVLEHYGTTETAQIATNLPPPGPAKSGTCGIPAPNTVMIVNENGSQVGPGDWGEILATGPTVMTGYLDDPELNEVSFFNGYFRTGDIGRLDEEGFLTLGGRLKEIINRGGEKISPMEVEVALLRHPDVAEAAAFGVAHPRLGEDVAAAVVLRPHADTPPDEIRSFLGKQLAWFKVPRRIRILHELPKGKTGKILRRRLREDLR